MENCRQGQHAQASSAHLREGVLQGGRRELRQREDAVLLGEAAQERRDLGTVPPELLMIEAIPC